jgi:hypothetical protein
MTDAAAGHGRAMSAWTPDELARVAAAQELEIAPVRRDGTLRPVPIWVVRAGDDCMCVPPVGRAAAGTASCGQAVGPGGERYQPRQQQMIDR